MKSVYFVLAAAFFATAVHADPSAVCRIPFERLEDTRTGQVFPITAAMNPRVRNQRLRVRYIVGDFNSTDSQGRCRGIRESYPTAPQLTEGLSDFDSLEQLAPILGKPLDSLAGLTLAQIEQAVNNLQNSDDQTRALALMDRTELTTELADLRDFHKSVSRFWTRPVAKPRVDNGWCIGESLNFCEIKNPEFNEAGQLVSGEPTLVYHFVTSSSRETPPPRGYYSPINEIHTRHWSADRPYTADDAARDTRLGGGDSEHHMFHNAGAPEIMPNFMNFVHLPGYRGENQNGIHEIAGGTDSGGRFGAPVSLGCVRLNQFQAKLARWWTPLGARFFIYLDPHRYVKHGDAQGNGRR